VATISSFRSNARALVVFEDATSGVKPGKADCRGGTRSKNGKSMRMLVLERDEERDDGQTNWLKASHLVPSTSVATDLLRLCLLQFP
jgi:hypothetical protein